MRPTAAVMTLVLLAGCGDDTTTSGGSERSVTVFAAASLSDAFAELAIDFESAHPGVDVQLSLAASSSLRQQILEGAPADVFASADAANMDSVSAAGALADEPRSFAGNRLQIAVPRGNPGGVTGLVSFADADLLIGLCAEEAPCGALAREALRAAAVVPSLDTNEPDVRALLTKIGAGELDAGIVYRTDVAAAAGLVDGIDIPGEHNVDTRYPIAVVAGAPHPVAAAAFVELVLSPGGRTVLAAHGFQAP